MLSPAPLVFLVLFLFTNPISKLAFPDEAQARTIGGIARAPIVVVLLDELPSNTLVDDRGRIDTERYPGFGELARNATWFKNAYTVYDSTERAQPAIMDGNLPTEDKQPISGDHPNSIFSLFGKTHRMNVSEEATSVCSRDICGEVRAEEGYPDRISSISEDLGLVWLHVVSPPDMEADLPSVSENWGNFGGRGGGRRAATTPASATPAPTSTPGASCASRSGSMTSATGAARSWPSSTRCCPTCRGSTCPTSAATGARPTTWCPGCPTRPSAGSPSSTCCCSATSCRPASPTASFRSCGAISRSRGSTTSR